MNEMMLMNLKLQKNIVQYLPLLVTLFHITRCCKPQQHRDYQFMKVNLGFHVYAVYAVS